MRFAGSAMRLAAVALSGLAYPLGFAPFGLFWLAPLTLAVLYGCWLKASVRQAALQGFVFGLTMALSGVSWIYVSLNQFGNMPAPLAAAAVMVFAALMALYPTLVGGLQACMGPKSLALRATLVIPPLWVLGEWLRGNFLSGFPWLYLGYSQVDTPLAALLPIAGTLGVSLLAALGVGTLVAFVYLSGRLRRLSGLVLLGLFLSTALIRIPGFVQPAGDPISVALVQHNVSLTDKWQSHKANAIAKDYLGDSEPISGVDLIVWPEGALPAYVDEIDSRFMVRLRDHEADFLLGALAREALTPESAYYNVAIGVGEESVLYRKHQLVPFGEYLPMSWLLAWIVDYLSIPMSDFSPGPLPQSPMLLAGHLIGVSICYEDAFSHVINAALPQAQVLANLSEDAWFGDSLAPHQRLQMARVRAIETGRPMIRSSNNGLSALIDAKGRVMVVAPQFVRTVVRGRVQPMTGTTPFVRWGNLPTLGLCVLLLGVGFWRRMLGGS
ncbi:MAG TPA: apolipoprotein N-acyltransferase [Gammaproteobacteria bacterium]|nr:apolipoprotein N-acyltransferase [Gammaproteobacteria bacterium]|tara:strand:- start:739 stop:2229 length:1491 start_codon:yes stop_codon:yes gene_type:complete